MSMNCLQLARRIPQRVLFECKNGYHRAAYLFRKAGGIDPLARRTASVGRRLGDAPKAFIQDAMIPVLAPYGVDAIRENAAATQDILDAAEQTLQNRLYVLHAYRSIGVNGMQTHMPWNTDVFSGYVYPVKYCRYYSGDAFQDNKSEKRDLKGPWELSRMQYLAAPALAWRMTGKGIYADKVLSILEDWISGNAVDEGPNWNCAMESGIRAVNMIMAFQLVIGYDGVTDGFCKLFIASMELHLKSILENLENYAGRTYNHYLGDIVGILAITASFPFIKGANELYQTYREDFEREIRRQVLPDGGSFEGAACYHGLVGEIFCLGAVMIRNHGDDVSDGYLSALSRMVGFSCDLRKQGSLAQPQIGDNDGGRVIEIVPHAPLDYAWFINMGLAVTKGYYESPYQRALQSYLTGVRELDERTDGKSVFFYPDFGAAGYKGARLYCLLSGTEAQKHGLGGHTHNDKLSMELSCDGEDFFVDPGSGVYTTDSALHGAFRSVQAHATVIVNGIEQNLGQCDAFFGNSHEAHCTIDAPVCEPGHIVLSGEATIVNPPASYKHRRRIDIMGETKIIVTDTIEADGPARVRINFPLSPRVRVELDGSRAVLQNGKARIALSGCEKWSLAPGLYAPSYGMMEESRIMFAEGSVHAPRNVCCTEIEIGLNV